MFKTFKTKAVKKLSEADGYRGDLAEFRKKRKTDYEFHPPLYVGPENNKVNDMQQSINIQRPPATRHQLPSQVFRI